MSQNVRYKGKNLTHLEKKKYNRSISQKLSGIWHNFNYPVWFSSDQYQMGEIFEKKRVGTTQKGM